MNSQMRFRLGVLLALAMTGPMAQSGWAGDPSLVGEFAGSSPRKGAIEQLLRIPGEAKWDLLEWSVTLYRDPATGTPSRYELRYEYGRTAQGTPGIAADATASARQGTWTTGKGIKSDPHATVYELDGGLAFLRVDADILQVLNPDRSPMIGNGGWSFTLNRLEHAEPRVDPDLAWVAPEMSYRISEPAAGPGVFGIFEGRTPCQGIARALTIPVDPGCSKAKWRVTLYQDAETRAPTRYKVEGSLFGGGPREGSWTVERGMAGDPIAVVYRLAAAGGEPALSLLTSDDNVLFLLDAADRPLVGHSEFSYTLNRRAGAT